VLNADSANQFFQTEMQQWWLRNEKLIPESYTEDEIEVFKSKVEDFTGSIPLLLEKSVVNEKIDLSADALVDLARLVKMFMGHIKRSGNTSDWDK
jgi:hypothetical protein